MLKPDKSNKTVIMNSDDYNNKMMKILSDTNTYTTLKMNPTNKYQKLNNDLIKSWESKNLISTKDCYKLKINNAQPPKYTGYQNYTKMKYH